MVVSVIDGSDSLVLAYLKKITSNNLQSVFSSIYRDERRFTFIDVPWRPYQYDASVGTVMIVAFINHPAATAYLYSNRLKTILI